MDRNIKADYVIPGELVNDYAGLPIDVFSIATSFLIPQFTTDYLDELFENIEDNEEIIVTVKVTRRSRDD
jgi:hypothetical protein